MLANGADRRQCGGGWDANEVEPGFVATRVIRGRALLISADIVAGPSRPPWPGHGSRLTATSKDGAVLPGRSESPGGRPTGCPKAPFILEMRESVTGDDGTTEFVVHAQGDHIDILGDPDERTSNYGVHRRERIV